MKNYTFQPALRPELPCVYGPIDYRQQRELFERIDQILSTSGLEDQFIELAIKDHRIDLKALGPTRCQRFYRNSILALRANIARQLTGLDHREFVARIADSQILPWFLGIGEVDSVKVFSKSQSDRFARWLSAENLRIFNDQFIALLSRSTPDQQATQQQLREKFGLTEELSFDEVFFDSTCLEANIHFPVDWVLLRDATRSLMKATANIRRYGLKNRMAQEPLDFLSQMNTLCMRMSAAARMKKGKKQRKQILREMKRLTKVVKKHAQRHLDLLQSQYAEVGLSGAQAKQISSRIEKVLNQLPAAIKQAHERIIGERQVANKDKILSLYEESIHIITRGKAGAKVEFGNKLWLGESRDGLIVDYALYEDSPTDSELLKPALERLVDRNEMALKQVWSDRGIATKANSKMLKDRKIGDGLCSRNVHELTAKLEHEEGFREGLKRRAATEARIGIFKNNILGGRLLSKGYEHRNQALGWGVLAHNLWLLGRLCNQTKSARCNARSQQAA